MTKALTELRRAAIALLKATSLNFSEACPCDKCEALKQPIMRLRKAVQKTYEVSQ